MSNLLSIFRSNAGKFKAELNDIREKLERNRQRREELRTMPLPAGETAGVLEDCLRQRTAPWAEHIAARLAHFTTNPLMDASSPGALSSGILFQNQAPSSQELEALLYMVFPNEIRAALEKMAARTTKKAGPARAQREAELVQLESQAVDLEKREREMAAELEAIRKETQV